MRQYFEMSVNWTVFGLLLLLAACTGGTAVNSTSTPVNDPSTLTESTTTTGITTFSTATGETTTTTAPPVTITTTENFVRFIHPDEWTRIRESCMIDAGWPVTTTPDGGIEFPDRPEDQNPVLEADWEVCSEMFPVDPKYRQPLTVAQLTFLYNWFIEESIPCLQGEGYTDFDPPSLDVLSTPTTPRAGRRMLTSVQINSPWAPCIH